MIGSIFNRYANLLNNASGNSLNLKLPSKDDNFIAINVTSFTGSIINPFLEVEKTKFSITSFNPFLHERGNSIDNHEHKPLHKHIFGSEINISGNYTLGTIGSFAFLEFLNCV